MNVVNGHLLGRGANGYDGTLTTLRKQNIPHLLASGHVSGLKTIK